MVLNKNNNNEHAEYHGIFIPFKDQIYSKQGSYVSFLFGTWNFCIIFPCLDEVKVSTGNSDLTNLVDVQRIAIIVYKNVIAVSNFFIKTFYLVVSVIEELILLRFFVQQQFFSRLPRVTSRQYLFISSRQSYLPLKLSTAYPLEKSGHKKIMLT